MRQKHRMEFKILLLLTFALNFYIFTFEFLLKSYAEPAMACVERSLLEGRYDKAVYESDRLLDSRASQQDEICYLNGLGQLKLNKYSDARQSFSRIISKYAGSKRVFDAYVGIGDTYFLEGDLNAAASSFNDILARFSSDRNIAIVYYRLGNCYKKMGSGDKAQYYFDKVRSLSPLSFETRMIPSYSKEDISPIPAPMQHGQVSNIKTTTESPNRDYYSVQVGSFKNRANAEKMSHRLSRSGYDSYLETPGASGYDLYRVKVGKYRLKEEAEKTARKLKRHGYSTKICNKDVCQ